MSWLESAWIRPDPCESVFKVFNQCPFPGSRVRSPITMTITMTITVTITSTITSTSTAGKAKTLCRIGRLGVECSP
jgi:hypothetical protein